MLNLILLILLTIVALKIVDFLLPDFAIHGSGSALIVFAIVLGLMNWLVKPALVFFSFPFIVLTIGLFYFAINALVLYFTAMIVPGVLSTNLFGIVMGSTMVSVVHWILTVIFRVKKKES